MTTNTTPADNLPNLTQLETDAAIAVAWGGPGACMFQIAAKLKLAPSELREILQRPHVVIYTQAARELQQMREEIAARRDHADTLHNLATIAKDPGNSVETRLHASIAVLRAVRDGPPATTSQAKSRRYLASTTSPRLSLPAPPKPPPVPVSTATATPTVPGGPKPDQRTNDQASPAPAPTRPPATSAPPVRTTSTLTLHHAAGAPLPRRAAPPPAPDRPP